MLSSCAAAAVSVAAVGVGAYSKRPHPLVIRPPGALPEDQVVAWSVQLLEALSYCHSQGICVIKFAGTI